MDSVIYGLNQRIDGTISLESCRFWHVMQSGILASGSAVHATNCFFSQNQGVLLNCGGESVISTCRFQAEEDFPDYMLIIGGVAGGGRVQDCIFTSSPPVLSNAIYVYYGGSGVGPPVEISDNRLVNWAGSASPIHVQYAYPHYTRVSIHANLFQDNRADFADWEPRAGAIQFSQIWSFDAGMLAEIYDNMIIDCQGPANGSNAIQACAGANIYRNRFFHLSPDSVPAIRMAYDSVESNLQLRDNLFFDTGTALRNDQITTPVDARLNWWGDSTGPYHATLNPNGQGDEIQGNVWFEPWYPDTSFLESTPGISTPLPDQFTLEAYPNPFNSSITLKLIPSAVAIVRVELFNVMGRRVQEIWSGPIAYEKTISFDGSHLSSGIYFVRVWQPIGNRPMALTKLVLLK